MRILIIEDEQKLAKSIKKGLEQESFAVDIAFDGEYGYDLAATTDYDAVVLDLMLPKLDGVEICRRLRRQNNQVPVIMLTARGGLEDKVDGLNSGADDYLTKPFAFSELLARLRALARRPRNGVGVVLTVEDLSLNTLSHEVKRGGRQIKLTRTEFALLEYLMRNKDKTLTKNQLIEHVWDYDADILPNTVEVYIGYLRNKIDKPFKNSVGLIQTVRGFGYKVGRR